MSKAKPKGKKRSLSVWVVISRNGAIDAMYTTRREADERAWKPYDRVVRFVESPQRKGK